MTCGDDLKGKLSAEGFRLTPQRLVIFEELAHFKGHRSAQEVYEAASERLPGLNLATVYRTLDSLHQAGLVDLMESGTDQLRFSLRNPDRPHAHLICRCCGETLELPAEALEQLSNDIRRRKGFALDLDHLSFMGLCKCCTEKSEDIQMNKEGGA
jgi:Fe2+ or Zn2+ uptake regulation protein